MVYCKIKETDFQEKSASRRHVGFTEFDPLLVHRVEDIACKCSVARDVLADPLVFAIKDPGSDSRDGHVVWQMSAAIDVKIETVVGLERKCWRFVWFVWDPSLLELIQIQFLLLKRK
eukprot:GHVO01048592.1.p2 GENE.GHVO01048592.1~~GHVO01048592.1.p2  ORF type:complete len:117 (+),score=11.22 GHVO01048592.1:211-561(+)